MIGLVWVSAAGREAARRLAAAWPGQTRDYPPPAATALPAAFAECDAVVAFLATGATVRLLAPHLGGKARDAGVVCVDEASRYAVALLGGHAGGANDLAGRVGAVLGAEPVVTTASDVTGSAGLDTFGAEAGWRLDPASDLAAVGSALLSGRPVALLSERAWPVPALPGNCHPVPTEAAVSPEAAGSLEQLGSATAPLIVVTDRELPPPRPAVIYRPPSLVVGVGASRGASAAELLELLDGALAGAGLSALSVRELATITVKGEEPGIVEAARRRGWPLVTHGPERLAAVAVPNPSERVRAEVGTASVAEAAAMIGTPPGELVVPKVKSAMATVAVARHRPRGRLALVGLGPGARELLTPRAVAELRRASVVVGLDQYLEQVRDLLRPGTRILASGLGAEEERAEQAVAEARAGHAVALVGSGDAGVYAMASPALELAGTDIDVVGVPGVTAALAAAALLGAPLGHDHAAISLSDLHTPWEAIERRVAAVAAADLVVTFYNPRSRGRDWQLKRALQLLAEHRPATTPVGVVRNASRPGQRLHLSDLASLDPAEVDMLCVVVVGSSATRIVAGRMVTPRGYRWRG